MTALSLPYVALPTFRVELPLLGPTTLGVFGPLVAVGVVVGYRLAMSTARQRGLDLRQADRLLVAVAIAGFIGAHLWAVLAYAPAQLARDPWILLRVHQGLASTGGFMGGALCFAWMCRRRKLDPRAHADIVAVGLLVGFTIGRLGCALVHDHPGAIAAPHAWFAVVPWPDGHARYDLGLLEFLLLLPLVGWVLWRRDARPWVSGGLTVAVAIAYAALRLPLDFLRADDPRWGGLTPAQYVCVAFVALALVWRRRLVSPRRRAPA